MNKKFLWVEEYRPHTIEDCILPSSIKESFNGFLNQKEIPNLMLCGSAGVGKTTIARALCEELGVSYLEINGSDEGRFLDTVRSKITQFATTVSLTSRGAHKVVIVDEADNTTQDVQMSLRHATEKFSSNCRFIFTCNFPNRIIEPLHSRCTVIDFKINGKESPKLQYEFFNRLKTILSEREVEFDEKVLAKVVTRYYPDWRRLLNEVQRFSSSGKLDVTVLGEISDINMSRLITSLKNNEFTTIRRWVVENVNNDPTIVFRKIYDSLSSDTVLKKSSVPELVLIIAKYSRDIDRVPDQEINLLACLIEIMMSCEFK